MAVDDAGRGSASTVLSASNHQRAPFGLLTCNISALNPVAGCLPRIYHEFVRSGDSMESPQVLLHSPYKPVVVTLLLVLVTLLLTSFGAAQEAAPAMPQADMSQAMKKYPGLMTEFGRLMQRIQKEVPPPAARSSSRLLPLLPPSTIFYLAMPNYGDTSQQALKIFHEELESSADLRAWWHEGKMAKDGLEIEDWFDRFHQLSEYLGDEVVVAGADAEHKGPKWLVVAEVRKPGLKEFLVEVLGKVPAKSQPKLQILDAESLARANDTAPMQPAILVRPDIVALGVDVATLRRFNQQLDSKSTDFAATEFGRRIARTYDDGASVMAGIDLQSLMTDIPETDRQSPAFERSGFGDAKYLVWTHKSVAGEENSQMELSFTGPRRGVASWLAAPEPMNSLNFVPAKPGVALAVALKDPAKILDEFREMVTASNPKAFAGLDQMQAGMGVNLRDDLLRYLGGEIAVEVEMPSRIAPAWTVVLSVKDAARVQSTLSKILTGMRMVTQPSDENGVTCYVVRVPSAQNAPEISYAFVDGYLVVASSPGKLRTALWLRHSGELLAKSDAFKAALPPGPSQFSGMLYEDPAAIASLVMARTMPGLSPLSTSTAESKPLLVFGYGEPTAIREASRSPGMDAGIVLMTAAIAIPNLLRARSAANEASAVGTVRTVNTAQVSYATAFPQKGYARSLAALGPDPRGGGTSTSLHAGLIDGTLGNSTCTVGVWCTKSGFKFIIRTACQNLQPCRGYVVIATPESANSGTRNFCSTSDGVVRFQSAAPLTAPIAARECRTWEPLQ
jgi:hypothetical protein